MIDINFIRENPEKVKINIKNRGYNIDIDELLKNDLEWRSLKQEADKLRAERNFISKKINESKKKKQDFSELIKKAKKIPKQLEDLENKEREIRERIDYLLARIPNIQADDVPVGGENDYKMIKEEGKKPKFNFEIKGHYELGKGLGGIDIERAVKIAGAGFYLLKGKLATLQRALIQFMLNYHIKEGFIEVNPPQLVNKQTAFGTGNLPKFEDGLYKNQEGMYLIPTAEVPVTNIHANETLREKDLPKKYVSFTECYRTEAGRHIGESGIFRLHQFEKVEMVVICKPEDSWKELEAMTKRAEKIIEMIGLPYRRILLATADASFASAKTYDIEVWSPFMNKYIETSSCSNCTDFQARRMNTKYQAKDGKLKFVHTLNGSGLALPRLMISIMENNQQKDGSIKVPKVLWEYTGFREITKENNLS